MVNMSRLENLQRCVEDVLADEVPGDLIETGVMRGGAVILMRAVLKAHVVEDRVVWAADSFMGVAGAGHGNHPQDEGAGWHLRPLTEASVDQVPTQLPALRTARRPGEVSGRLVPGQARNSDAG